MMKTMVAMIGLIVWFPTQAQVCATKSVDTASGPALACASTGAACDGGAGKCVRQSVKTGPNASLCHCAHQGGSTTADPVVDVRNLVMALSSAKRGDTFSFSFGPGDLEEQQVLLFAPNLFDASPKIVSAQMTVEVIGRGKRPREHWRGESTDEWFREDETGRGFRGPNASSPSLNPDTVELSITGSEVLEPFTVNGVGSTGVNTETFVAGTMLFNLRKLLFEGVLTSELTNDIWTKKNPIVMVEGWGGSLDRTDNSVRFETGAPDASFIVPALVSPMTSVRKGPVPAPKDRELAETTSLVGSPKVPATSGSR